MQGISSLATSEISMASKHQKGASNIDEMHCLRERHRNIDEMHRMDQQHRYIIAIDDIKRNMYLEGALCIDEMQASIHTTSMTLNGRK